MKLNKSSKKYLSAYSLLQLSSIILIISLVATIVTIGAKAMISSVNLVTARSLTNSSPVRDIDNLQLWLETTTTASFEDDERVDGASVSRWNDINPQSAGSDKYDATQSDSAKQPAYTRNAINGMPALFFDDALDGMAIDTNLSLDDDYTIFIVFNSTGTSAARRAMPGDNNWLIGPYAGQIRHYAGGWVSSTYSLTLEQFYITTALRTSSTSAFYINGTDQTDNSSPVTSPGNIGLGSVTALAFFSEDLSGYIAEVIVYDRALNTTERELIEEYLSKKWKIDLDS